MKYRLLSSIYYENKGLYEEIYNRRINSESTYRYNFKINDDEAFFVITNEILQQIDKILKLDKQLSLKSREVPSIALYQYTKRCIVDEIKMTNDIEGVVSTRKEINEILNDSKGSKKGDRLYGLVKKYEMLIEEDIELNTCNDIRSIYNELVLQEVVEEETTHEPDGAIFRKDTVYLRNPHGKIIHTGLNPEDKIIEVMSECLSVLNSDSYNKLVSIAVFHYMFGYIHPFYDGNGRTSRFISSYLLARELNSLVAYRISHTIKQNINSYYKSFKTINDVKNKGDITKFVESFFDILVESLEELCSSIDERKTKLKFFKNQIDSISNLDSNIKNLFYILVQNTLFGESGLGVQELIKITKLSDSKTRSSISELINHDLLYVNKDGKKKIYDVDLDKLSDL